MFGGFRVVWQLIKLQIRGFNNPDLAETEGAIPDVLDEKFTTQNVEHIEKCWQAEIDTGNPSILRLLLWRLHPVETFLGLWWSFVYGGLTCFARPWCLRLLVDAAQSDDINEALKWAGVLTAVVCTESVAFLLQKHEFSNNLASAYINSISLLIQRKALHLAPGAAGDTSERTLVATDVITTYESSKLLCQLPMGVFSLAWGTVMLVMTIGWVGAVGVGMMIIFLMMNIWLSEVAKQHEKTRLGYTDRRLGIVTRAIEAIKAVKFCAWEERFLNDIREARDEEISTLRRFRSMQFTNVSLGRINPILCAAATYIILAGLGRELEPGMVYAVLTVFQAMRLALIVVPLSLTYIASFSVSFARYRNYLTLPENHDGQAKTEHVMDLKDATFRWPKLPDAPPSAGSGSKPKKTQILPSNSKELQRTGSGLGTPSAPFCMRGVNIQVKKGEKIGIVGGVGSGKSSLISAILGDMLVEAGEVNTDLSSVGFVPQRPFIIHETLAENILFGRPYDAVRFDAAIHAASMASDLAILPDGRNTELGERGVTLSGGQQQRLAIARALYGAPNLLVMDDPLAAVDGRVASQILSRVVDCADEITGQHDQKAEQVHPKDRVVVMALNQFRFLRSFDRVIYLRNGKVEAQGPPQQLLDENASFREFVGGIIGDEKKEQAAGTAAQYAPVEEEAAREKKGGLVAAEKKGHGKVEAAVYKNYVAGMGCWRVALALSVNAVAYVAWASSDLWLAHWVSQYPDGSASDANSSAAPVEDVDAMYYIIVYAAASIVFLIAMIASGISVAFACSASSQSLHDRCLNRVMRAPVSFFEATPSGRIISRLGSDMAQVDNFLQMLTEGLTTFTFTLIVLCIVIGIIAPVMFAVLLGAGVVYYFQVVAQDRTNQQLKREANAAMTPVLNTLGEIGEGRLLIRVMGFQSEYCQKFDSALNHLNRMNFLSTSLLNSCAFGSYVLALCISSGTAFFILRHGNVSPSSLGLALTYSFLLPYFLQMYALLISMFTMAITSLERLLQCASDEVPQEPDWEVPDDRPLIAADWPKQGGIKFEDATLIYRPGLPPALKQCNLEIEGGSKVGIVGRTGAGKSSLFVLLFRLVDAAGGKILLDGEDISKLGLMTLRQRMAIIPQEPLLLEGTVRANIDPFGEHSDERVYSVLQRVGLAGKESSLPRHLSAGERQLLQMARTLLRDVRIVVMDEPTSNIDPQTDALIQSVVREEFSRCTVITIAHRLETVIDGDAVIVMSKGQVEEMGPAFHLLRNPLGALSSMVDSQGELRAAELRRLANTKCPKEEASLEPEPEVPKPRLSGDTKPARPGSEEELGGVEVKVE